ncbi:MAG: restriction endonuclease subunit S [Cyanobacteriota bacterium]
MRWPKACLGDVAQVVSGATPKSSVDHYWDGNIPWITPADLSNLGCKEVSVTSRQITAAGLSSCSARLLPARSVLFSSRAPIGHVAINTVPMATNQGFKSFVPDHEILSSDYLYWWLKSNKSYLQSLGRGATFKEVSKEIVESIEIPLPPLEEQRRIAAILDKSASLAAAQQRRTELLWRIEASLFGQMSEKTACESKKCTLKDLTADGDKINYGVVQPGNQVDGGIPLIRVGDLMSGGVDRSALKCIDPEIESAYARSRIKGNELLLSCVGSIGTVAEVGPADIGSNIARAVARIPVSEAVNRKWLAACLRSSAIQRYFTNELRTVSQPTLNIKQIEETAINLPPIELQNAFASKLYAVERVCKRSSFSETQTRDMISVLQSRAFSGLLQLQ